jgi:DNA-binding transcriptional MerR regulator
MSKMLKIGELSEASGSTIDTIRFYESKGLINPEERGESGYRFYKKDAISVLKFIQISKDLGFTLTEIKDFLELKVEKGGICTLALEAIEKKEVEIENKINSLKNIRKALKKVSQRCQESDGERPCHFLDLLN